MKRFDRRVAAFESVPPCRRRKKAYNTIVQEKTGELVQAG